MKSRVSGYAPTIAGASKTVKAAVPSPIKRLVKGLFAPYRRYRLSTVRPSQRAEADWAFLQKISSTPQPLLTGDSRTRNRSLTPVGPGDASANSVRLDALDECGAPTRMNVVIISYHTYNNNSALHITGFANALTALGHRIVVSAIGPVSDAETLAFHAFVASPISSLVRIRNCWEIISRALAPEFPT
jgi:hypothetical protein